MKAVGVSRDTARRDIVALDAQGVARRTRGGLVSLSFGHTIPSYSARLKRFSTQKTKMAKSALTLIKPGGVYFIDDSTTLLKLSQSIRQPVTVYTHSLDNAIALSVEERVNLHLLVANWIITPGSSLNQRCLKHFAESPLMRHLSVQRLLPKMGFTFPIWKMLR